MASLLDAVNTLLTSAGGLPVNSLSVPHPGRLLAEGVIARFNKSVQSKGYWFNTEYALQMLPSTDGTISIPPNTLACDAAKEGRSIVIRGSKLYDMDNHTFQFDLEVELCVDFIYLIEYEDLPYTAYNHIVAQSEYKYLVNRHSDKDSIATAKENVPFTAALLQKAEFMSTDVNALASPAAVSLLGGINGLRTVGYRDLRVGRYRG
jgi:hypothetical protein